MDEHFNIKTENNFIEEDGKYIPNKLEMKFPVKIEKGLLIKDGLDVEFTKVELHLDNGDESKDWNINKTISEEVLRNGSINNRQQIYAPWPLSIRSSVVKGAGMGVWTKADLPIGFTFGPYEGKVLDKEHDEKESGTGWKIQDKSNLGISVDVVDTSLGNWLRFINWSRTYEEANLVIFRCGGQISCKTITEIKRGAELMMWYDDESGRVPSYQPENLNEDSTTTWAKEMKTPSMKFSLKSNLLRMQNSCHLDPDHGLAIPFLLNSNENNSNDNTTNHFINMNNLNVFSTNYIHERPLHKTFSDRQLEISKLSDDKQNNVGERESSDEYAIKPCKNYKCPVCGNTFNHLNHLKMHLPYHSGEKPYKCSHCHKAFTLLRHLKKHLEIHSGVKPYKCAHCDKSFNQLNYLKMHLHIHNGEKSYKCSQCEKVFPDSSRLNRHLRIHTGEKPYKCSQCNKEFRSSGNYRRHLRVHTGERPYKCSQCDKAFTVSYHLKIHLRIHSSEKHYKCAHCDKAFNQFTHLKTHLRIHSGEKPYKCSQCDKVFTDSSQLKRHFRIHSGEKPYKCCHCNKAFTESGSMKRHRQTHTLTEKSYKCSQCDKAFSESSSLKRHLRIHSTEKPYNCSQCDKAYSRSDDLKKHLRIHIGEEAFES